MAQAQAIPTEVDHALARDPTSTHQIVAMEKKLPEDNDDSAGVRVLCWLGSGNGTKGFGHAALQFGTGSGPDDGYISWWPSFAASKFNHSGGGQPNTYDGDVTSEGRVPDFEKKLFNLDRSAINEFWIEWKANETYDLATRNCCDCVFGALAKGGAAIHMPALEDQRNGLVYIPSQIKALTEALAALPDNNPV